LNDWEPYQKLLDFGFNINLCQLSQESIAENLNFMIDNLNKFELQGEINRGIIKCHFDFNKNIKTLMNELSSL
jgi:hypothetical protein